MFKLWKQLRQIGVLGINRRNAEFTLNYNLRRLYPLVDDKLLTKKLALDAGIAVPKLYGVIESEYQIRTLRQTVQPHSDSEETASWSLKDGLKGCTAKQAVYCSLRRGSTITPTTF